MGRPRTPTEERREPASAKSQCKYCGQPVGAKLKPRGNGLWRWRPNKSCTECTANAVGKAKRLSIVSFADGSQRITRTGYREIKVSGTWILEHRHVMARHLGRALDIAEHIHHINHDPLDNRIDNLVVMTASEHAKHHHLPLTRWSVISDQCARCGRSDRKHVGRGICGTCWSWAKTHACLNSYTRINRQRKV